MPGPADGVRAAVERGAWQRALDLLDGGTEGPRADAGADVLDAAEALELRAKAAYGAGEFEACVTAWEDLHTLLVERGDTAEGAGAAAMVAMYIMMDTGLMAPVRGWIRRAERLLAGHDEVPAHALVAMVGVYERLLCGDADGVREQSARAVELGERLGVLPAVVIGRVGAARSRILDGHVTEGLDLLDEVGALLMSGTVDPLTTGMMYCELICVAQGMALHDRAAEWTEVMERWRHGAAFGGINGRCRVHRAEMFRFSGPCERAEAEALKACEELRPWMRREFGWPLVELGTIRLRKGDLAGAEAAFLEAYDHAWSPQPWLALLRLEQGDAATAAAMIAEAIAHPFDVPSKERPPFGDLRLAPLFEAQVEIAATTGDAHVAREAAARLRTTADSYPSRSLDASARLAAGRAALVADNLDAAVDECSAAVAIWAELGAPFETAVARMALGQACNRSGHTEGARMEWTSARTAFEAFGAQRWASRAGALVADPSHIVMVAVDPSHLDADFGDTGGVGGVDPNAGALDPDDARRSLQATFRRDGDTREIDFAGRTAHLRDLKGCRYVARLLAEPGREFHVLDLVAVDHGTLRTPHDHAAPNGGTAELGHGRRSESGMPVIDDQARAAYKRRLAEVQADIDDAVAMNDSARVELAERDREYLIRELERAVGLGGRSRTTGGSSERARTAVTRSIRYAVARLAEHHPELGAHLDLCVRTGTYCSYSSDPVTPVAWTT